MSYIISFFKPYMEINLNDIHIFILQRYLDVEEDFDWLCCI